MDKPSKLSSAIKEVLQPFMNVGGRVRRGDDLHRKIRGTRKKGAAVRLEPEALQARLGDKRNVRCAAVAIMHPVSHARTEDNPQPVRPVKTFQREIQAFTN